MAVSDPGFAALRARRGRRGDAGFTLIELVVVMVVMAVVTVTVVIGIGNIRGANVDTEAGQLAAAVRYLYNLSVLNGRNYRLIVDLDSHAWWGEAQDSRDPCKQFLLPGEGEEEGREVDEDDEGNAPPPAAFGAAKSALLQKRELPKGIAFVGAMTSHQSDIERKGQVHLNFFPNGSVEAGFVLIGDSDDDSDVVTVEVLPLQGTARVYNGELTVDDWLDQER